MTDLSTDKYERSDVEFSSGGDTLHGWLYLPAAAVRSTPCIVLTHGFSAVKEQYLDCYSDIFASAGFAVLTFDHPCFGASGGLPRQEVDPGRQIAGIQDAISFLQTLTAIDPDRIGLWGSSYSGGHVLSVAARDHRIAAVVAQVPTISGSRAGARRPSFFPSGELDARFDADINARTSTGFTAMIPVTSSDSRIFAALPGHESHNFFQESMKFAPTWKNEVTLQSVKMARNYEPGQTIESIAPIPLLMIVVDDDHLTPADLAIEDFDRLTGTKELHILKGGHFDPYTRLFGESSSLALNWFIYHLRGDVGSVRPT